LEPTNAAAGWFACPTCGKQYRFKPEIAGKKAQCKGCGSKFVSPAVEGEPARLLELGSTASAEPAAPLQAAAPPAAPPALAIAPADDGYELALPGNDPISLSPAKPEAVVKHQGKCPQCGSKLKPEAILCLNCGYNLAEGKKVQTEVGEVPDPAAAQSAKPTGPAPQLLANQAFSQATSRVAKRLEAREDEDDGTKTDYIIPLSVLGAGVLLIILNALVVYDPYIWIDRVNKANSAGFGVLMAAPEPIVLRLTQLARMGFTVLLQIPFLFIGLLLVAKLFGTSFGYIVPAMIKILACAVAVNAIDYTVYFLLDRVTDGFAFIGSMFSSSVSFATFWALTSWLFDLEIMEMFVLYVLTAMLPIYGGALIFALLYTAFA